ncbi:MAG: hypothetical protein E7062_01275 [Spirochaetaceae bacterium]|nr:hypothetical protein [Spirochaetaceae bacterium]
MAFFDSVIDFFSSLFSSSSGQKADLKKIEHYLKNHEPSIYKNEMLLPSFGEAFFTLYKHTKLIGRILDTTLFSENKNKVEKCINLLFCSGLDEEGRTLFHDLEFENRKEVCIEENNSSAIYETQKKQIEKMLHSFQKSIFLQIEKTLRHLTLLKDLCDFNYVTCIRYFNNNFSPERPVSSNDFLPVQFQIAEQSLLDFYYISADFEITSLEAKALSFLLKMSDLPYDEEHQRAITIDLQKILGVIKKILSSNNILTIVKLIKKDTSISLENHSYNEKYLEQFLLRLKKHYEMDTLRLRTEVKNSVVSHYVTDLFGEKSLAKLSGYDAETNQMLIEHDTKSFQWIQPIEIFKTFFNHYFTEEIRALLNDLVVEGFFNNPEHKTEISSALLSGLDIVNQLEEFEALFKEGATYDKNKIKNIFYSEIRDNEAYNGLSLYIDEINQKVFRFLQDSVNAFLELYQTLDKIFIDSKKSHQTYIINVNLLFHSARNKDAYFMLESYFPYWKKFLDIMTNYVIIKWAEN